MKALVTGSAGFIGSHLVAALRGRGDEAIGLDLADGHDIVTCDLPDADAVYHLAAQTDAYFEDAEADARTNVLGSVRIFRRYGHRVVFASTAMVNYPANPYAIGKRACEDYARLYGVSVVRLCNICGPGGHSVFERFAAADELTIFGTGQQRRNYAPVGAAVSALLAATGTGRLSVVTGEELTVLDVADRFPTKARRFAPPKAGDMLDGRQVA